MRQAYEHCETLVREVDRDRFIAALFAPPAHRPHLYALYAFDIEIARVGQIVHEALAGEIRLQWWRDALAGDARGEISAHPVAAALIDTIARCSLPADRLRALIDARAHDLYGEPYPTLGDLEHFGSQTAAAIFALAAHVLDGTAPAAAVSDPAGKAVTLAGARHAIPREAARGRISVPLDLLDRHGVDGVNAYAAPAGAGLRLAAADLAGRARGWLDEVRRNWDAVPRAAHPAFLPLAPLDRWLARVARDPDPLTPVGLAPWRRQLIIWRAARRGQI
jgi:phytoene synthase